MSYISQIKTPDGELYNIKDSEAKSYTDAEVLGALGEAKTYSDINLATAKNYAESQDYTTLSNAKAYAAGEANTALDSAKSYTDTEVSNVLAEAKTYSDGNLNTAKTYANGLPFSSMTAVTASSEANVGFTNVTTDNKRVPTMSFMAYWNGRYNSSSSNLKYCNKGAFGDLATLSKNSSTANFLRGDGTWSNTLAGTFTVNGQLNVQNAKNFVCWSGSNSGNFVKIVTTASTENYNQIASNNNFNYCAGNHQFRNYGNTAWAPAYASAFTNSSSIRYKKNVVEMTEEDAKKLLELRPVTYDYINELDGADCKGMIAEEVYEVQPWGVVFREEEVEGLDYSKFVPQLIKLCQIQQKEIDELKAKIEGGI